MPSTQMEGKMEWRFVNFSGVFLFLMFQVESTGVQVLRLLKFKNDYIASEVNKKEKNLSALPHNYPTSWPFQIFRRLLRAAAGAVFLFVW